MAYTAPYLTLGIKIRALFIHLSLITQFFRMRKGASSAATCHLLQPEAPGGTGIIYYNAAYRYSIIFANLSGRLEHDRQDARST